MALVRCFTIFAVLCFLCSTGCIRKQPSSSSSSENQQPTQGPDSDIPTYVVDTGPDVEIEPPSPFFKHHKDGDEDDKQSSVPIASDDTSLFNQPSPFDERKTKVATAQKLDLAVLNGVESAVGKSKQLETEAAKTQASEFQAYKPEDYKVQASESEVIESGAIVPIDLAPFDSTDGTLFSLTKKTDGDQLSSAKKTDGESASSVTDKARISSTTIESSRSSSMAVTKPRPKNAYPPVERVRYVNNIPLDEAFPLQDHVPAIHEDPVSKRPTSHIVATGDTLWGVATRFKLTTKQLIAANRGVNDANVIAIGMKLLIPPVDYDASRPYVVAGSQPRGAAPSSVKKSQPVPSVKSVDRTSYTQQPKSPHKKQQSQPKVVSAPSIAKKVKVHVLQPGETLWSVAREYRISVTDLMLLNRLSQASSLRAGREILVPSTGDASSGSSSSVSSSKKTSSKKQGTGNGATQYEVVKGDTLWRISREFSVTVAELIQWNQGKNLDKLNVGMSVNVSPPGRSSTPAASKTYSSNRPSTTSTVRATKKPTQRAVPTRRPAPTRSPQTKPAGTVAFRWPLRGEIIKSFGWYDGKPHTGVDIKGAVGEKVKASAAGNVIFAGPMRGYGKVAIIDHRNGHFTVYGNLLEVLVRKGTAKQPVKVRAGTYVGRIGAVVEGPVPCLHFEMRIKNKAIDPMKYLGF